MYKHQKHYDGCTHVCKHTFKWTHTQMGEWGGGQGKYFLMQKMLVDLPLLSTGGVVGGGVRHLLDCDQSSMLEELHILVFNFCCSQ